MTSTAADMVGLTSGIEEPRIVVGHARTRADRIYRGLATGAGMLTLSLLFVIGLFLFLRALPALRYQGASFLTTYEWIDAPEGAVFGIAALMFGTVVIALIALVIALPVSIAAGLFITEYAPRRLRKWLTSLVDLLAAVPSLIFGIWGLFFLQPQLVGLSRWLSVHASFIPSFETDRPVFTSSPFIAGVVVSLMIVPIITSVVREVFTQTPPAEKEAALALGGTKWGMIRTVVLPFGRGGIIGGSMLGLGRALGETIAIAVIISPTFVITPKVLEAGGGSIASHIANRFGDATPLGLSALMAAGLALFVVTLIVNMVASVIVSRSRSGAGVDA